MTIASTSVGRRDVERRVEGRHARGCERDPPAARHGEVDDLRAVALLDRDRRAVRRLRVDRRHRAPRRRTARRGRAPRARGRTSRPCSRRRRSPAMRSAPTTTAWTRPRAMSEAAATSGRSVTGRPSFASSQAVRRAPCRNGRVSSARTATPPSAASARTTPSAVPIPAVARAPALQCVRTVGTAGARRARSQAAPRRPISTQAARSSAAMRSASASSRQHALGRVAAGRRDRDGAHPRDGRREVHRRRAGGREPLGGREERRVEIRRHARQDAPRLRAHPVRRRDADERSSADREAPDRLGRLDGARALEDDLLVREPALVEERQDAGAVRVRHDRRRGTGRDLHGPTIERPVG